MRHGWLFLVLALGATVVAADPVNRPFEGGTLEADYTPPEGGRGVVLIYPDASRVGDQGHLPLEEGLREAGFGVLVVQPGGQGGRCDRAWRRLHRDGMEEIGAWFDWLLQRGRTRVHFMGYGRGANQVAWFLAKSRHPAFGAAALLDPMVWRPAEAGENYRRNHGQELASLLARASRLREAGRGDELLRGIGFLHCEEVDVTAAALLSYYGDQPDLDTSRLLGELPGAGAVLVGPNHPGIERLEAAAASAGLTFESLPGGIGMAAEPLVAFLRGGDAAREE